MTHSWLEGSLTNWEYLIELNQISGRTFQDLMQYPVFPWILADYTSDTLDLNDAASFRRLDRPIAVQQPESEAHYIANYSVSATVDDSPFRECERLRYGLELLTGIANTLCTVPGASAKGYDPQRGRHWQQ